MSITPRVGTMDADIVAEMSTDPYFVHNHIKAGDTVVDCGANIGAFADYVLTTVPGVSKIVCIEPMPSNLKVLRENLKGHPNCEIVPAALMGHSGTLDMYDFGETASACHSIYKLDSINAVPVAVDGVTLEEIMGRHKLSRINFLKLDVQGAEYEIIPNYSPAVLDKIDYIAMEMHFQIAKTGETIGYIPDADQKISQFIRHLSQTHVIVSGWPKPDTMLLWRNKREVNLLARAIGSSKAVIEPAWRYCMNIPSRIKACVPRTWRGRIRAALGR